MWAEGLTVNVELLLALETLRRNVEIKRGVQCTT